MGEPTLGGDCGLTADWARSGSSARDSGSRRFGLFFQEVTSFKWDSIPLQSDKTGIHVTGADACIDPVELDDHLGLPVLRIQSARHRSRFLWAKPQGGNVCSCRVE